MEFLEQRRLLTVTASMVGSELVVDVSGSDSATITQDSNNNVVVENASGANVFSVGPAPVAAASVTDILVVPSGRNDQVLFSAIDTAKAYTGLNTITVQADSSGAVTTIGGTLTTSGSQSYDGPINLPSATTLVTTNSAVTFGGTIDDIAASGGSLTVSPGSGNVQFGGAIGGTGPIASLTVNSTGTTTLDGNVTTNAAQNYNGPVILGGNTLLTSKSNSDVSFASTLDAATAGAQSLEVAAGTGNITFAGAVGGNTALGQVTVDSANNLTVQSAFQAASLTQSAGTGTTDLKGAVTVSGVAGISLTTAAVTLKAPTITATVGTIAPVVFSAPVTMAGDVVIDTSAGGGSIDFSTADGAHQLSLAAGKGDVTFTGGVGSATPLSALTITSASNVTLGSSAAQKFDSGSLNVSGLAGILTVNGTIVPSSTATLGAPTITFTASQAFGSASISLATNSLTQSSGVTLAGTGTLTIGAASSTQNIDIGGSGEGLSLPANTISSLSGFAEIIIGGSTATGTITADAATTFSSPIEFELQSGGSGKVVVNGPLKDTATGTSPGIAIHGSGHTTTLNSDIVTHGTPIVIDDSIVLGSPSTIRLDTTDGGSAAGGAAITLASPGTVNDDKPGSSALILNGGTGGTVTLAGAVGTSVPITALTAIGSTIAVSGGSVVTFQSQSYTGNVSLLSGLAIDTTASGAASGGNVQFAKALNGTQNLAIAAGTGVVTFAGAVGASTPLADVTINSAGNVTVQSTITAGSLTQAKGSGVTQLNGPVNLSDTKGLSVSASAVSIAAPTITVSAAGAPVTFSAPVTLTGNVTVNTAKGVLGPVLFGGSLDSDSLSTPRALTIDGNATFDGAIGATYPLASLTVTGTSLMKAGNARVVNSTFEQPVTLTSDTTLSGNVTFDGSVDSLSANPPLSLTIDALSGGAGAVVFYAPVGAVHALKSLTVNVSAAFKTSADGTSQGGAVTTELTQTYGGPTTFQGNANLATTQGDVDFNAAVTLGNAATAAISSNSGNVNFDGTVDGSSALTTDTPGTTTFSAAVGAGTVLTSMHVVGPTNFGGPAPLGMATVQSQPRKSAPLTTAPVILAVNCNGPQSYAGPVLVQASVGLYNITSGNIEFGSTVDSMNASELTVDTLVNNNNVTTATGVVQFDGAVGSLGELANLAILSGGPFLLNAPVNSAGNIIVTVQQNSVQQNSAQQNSGGPAANLELGTGAVLNASGDLKLLSSNNVNIDAGSTLANATGTVTIKCDYLNGAGAEINLAGAINSPTIQISGAGHDALYINDPGALPGTDSGQTLTGFGFADSATINYTGVHPEIITPVAVPSIAAGTTQSDGETIATLLNSSAAFSGGAVVVDVLPGIAVTGLNDTNTADGTWQYSTDGGMTWTDFGSPGDTSALLLGATDEIRFESGSNVVARNGFVFRAWDGHTGTDGGTYNTNGGTAIGFSSTTQTVTIEVVAPSPPGGAYVIGSGTISVPANLGILRYVPTGSNETVTGGSAAGDQGGTFTFNADGSFTYTPGASFPGYDSANATVTDSHGNQVTAPVVVLSQHAGVVWKFYEAVLNRTPDPGGLQYWTSYINNGGNTGDMAYGFFESDELLNEIITSYYQQYLGRTPDDSGLAYWRGVWHATGGPEGIKAGFADSPEFYNANGPTPASWLTGLYEKILNRTPDPSGYQYWLNYYQQQLAAGADPGVIRQTIALGFFDSAEAYGNYVTGWYQEYLFRAPTDTEKAQYVNQMEGGATDRTIEQSITNLPEYAGNPPTPASGTAAVLPDYYQNQGSAQSQAVVAAKDAVFSGL